MHLHSINSIRVDHGLAIPNGRIIEWPAGNAEAVGVCTLQEILPLAAAELAKPEAAEIRVLWASRTEGDTFWTDQLQALKLQVHVTPLHIRPRLSRFWPSTPRSC